MTQNSSEIQDNICRHVDAMEAVSVKWSRTAVDCGTGVKRQTEGKLKTADCRLFNWILLPFPSLRANRKQANRSVLLG